jgi:flagellar basal-body rod protein FlgB
MPIIENPTQELLERALAFRDARHTLIASNIANSNTPGFSAFDAVLREQLDGSRPLQLQQTSPQHLGGDELDRAGAEMVRSRTPARLDGNNVSLDEELVKLLENRTMYQAGFELLDRWASLTAVARDVR